ncbi:MAG: TMEM165/GDT1 family protein [Alphaproteobacteria bacterium]|nr:TMEM165/GDT1 family protein [Alphaproteobacteria bacterium]
MEALLISSFVVAIAEIGDKTQLLALVLAARFRKPVPIILGILLATLANHGLAAWAGGALAQWLGLDLLRWILGLSFLAMAAWILVPDKEDEDGFGLGRRYGPFLATLATFFLVEIGDKTQIATIALAARFNDLMLVTLGTTLGMMLANVPAVLVGEAAASKVPLKLVHGLAAAIFAILGLLALAGFGLPNLAAEP